MDYREILSARDASVFDRETNKLHDGYLVSVNYMHDGYAWGNPLFIDSHRAELILRIMVTSIHNTLVEILFEGVREFQIKDTSYELVDSSIALSKEGIVTWCADTSTEPETLRDANYVVAEKMKWKIIL